MTDEKLTIKDGLIVGVQAGFVIWLIGTIIGVVYVGGVTYEMIYRLMASLIVVVTIAAIVGVIGVTGPTDD